VSTEVLKVGIVNPLLLAQRYNRSFIFFSFDIWTILLFHTFDCFPVFWVNSILWGV